MNDEHDAPRAAPGEPGPEQGREQPDQQEPVGSVGEEAAKLFGALSDWARDQGADYGDTAAGAASSFTRAAREVNEHIATGGEDCRFCPVCQVIHLVRDTNPEVRTHLAVAASSLMHAAAGLLATRPPDRRSGKVEKINLDEDSGWDEEQ